MLDILNQSVALPLAIPNFDNDFKNLQINDSSMHEIHEPQRQNVSDTDRD